MAIVINGSGTISGISVGGLPDSIVDAGTLATNSVDSAELIDGAVDNSHMAAMAASKLTGALPAISAANLTGIPAANITGTLPAISGANLTGLIAGTGAFSARGTQSWVNMSADDICQFNNDSTGYSFDTDNNYNASTFKYTAPADGVYFFFVNIYTAQNDASSDFNILRNSSELDLTGESNNLFIFNSSGVEDRIVSGSITLLLEENDTIAIKASSASDMYPLGSSFGGCRLK